MVFVDGGGDAGNSGDRLALLVGCPSGEIYQARDGCRGCGCALLSRADPDIPILGQAKAEYAKLK